MPSVAKSLLSAVGIAVPVGAAVVDAGTGALTPWW
jgi:hypothetical protein